MYFIYPPYLETAVLNMFLVVFEHDLTHPHPRCSGSRVPPSFLLLLQADDTEHPTLCRSTETGSDVNQHHQSLYVTMCVRVFLSVLTSVRL